MKGPIQAVDVSFFAHATEDAGRITGAVEKVLGVDVAPEVEELEGHFGNRITRVIYHVIGEAASTVFSGLVTKMPHAMKVELLRNLGSAVDEHSALYIRLDKQALLAGGFAFASTDPIRIRVKPRMFLMRGAGGEFYRKVIGGAA